MGIVGSRYVNFIGTLKINIIFCSQSLIVLKCNRCIKQFLKENKRFFTLLKCFQRQQTINSKIVCTIVCSHTPDIVFFLTTENWKITIKNVRLFACMLLTLFCVGSPPSKYWSNASLFSEDCSTIVFGDEGSDYLERLDHYSLPLTDKKIDQHTRSLLLTKFTNPSSEWKVG